MRRVVLRGETARVTMNTGDAGPALADDRLIAQDKPGPEEIREMLNLANEPVVERTHRTGSEAVRIREAAWSFATRRVPVDVGFSLSMDGPPRVGDLVLARIDVLGHHKALQLTNGRRRQLFVDDEVVVAYGNRYACNQFEAVVPETMGPCHLVAGGGIASRAISWHDRITRGPTHITPIGLICDVEGRRINLQQFALPKRTTIDGPIPTTIAVVGTAMDSGKTQTAAYLARGLIAAGIPTGYAKVTGTGAGGDTWLLKDAGADPVLDFTDAGLPSTYLAELSELESVLKTLVAQMGTEGAEGLVIEVADGVFQRETSALLRSSSFASLVGGIVFAARDSMGASAGVHWLSDQPTRVLALSGLLSAAPLQSAEAQTVTGLPVYNREQLAAPEVAMDLISQAQQQIAMLLTV